MAFTGSATFTKVSDNLVRCTGLSLAAAASGVLGLFGCTVSGAVVLPEDPTQEWGEDGDVTLIESVNLVINPASDVANFAIPIRITKTGTAAGFGIALENDAAAVASADLEIYIRYR